MTRVAVIGVGAMGKNHVRVYQQMPEAELVAIVDQDRVMAEQVSRIYHVPFYTSLFEMLDRERPDAVSVVVPTQAHYAVVKLLLEAGCHVLVEKPIAASLVEAHEMVRLAEEANKVLMVGHIERFNPAIIELKRRLEMGALGRVFQVHARRLGPFPTRIRDVGVIMDLATHDLDIMRYLVGSEVTRVFAETKREVHAHCEDLILGILNFDDSTLGLLEINWLTPTKIRKLYVTGERGMFRVNYITQDLCFFENAETNDSDWAALSLLRGVSEGSKVQFAIQKKEPLRAELEAFLANVRGEGSQIVNGYDATVALSLATALVDSAWNGEVKEVTPHEINRSATKESIPLGMVALPKVSKLQARA